MKLLKRYFLVALLPTFWLNIAQAAPTAEEAAELGKSLTALGAEKAGNAAGTIPAFEGGLCKAVPGYKPKNGKDGWPYIDPFADEKPRLVIDSKNMTQYADQLTEGTKVLLERYPETFKVNVYPTHRTACFPDYVYKNTVERVMNPKLVGNAPGVTGAHAQVPFPIPKNGYEVMWNALLRFGGPNERGDWNQYVVDNAGNQSVSNISISKEDHEYWDNSIEGNDDTTFWRLIATQTQPVAQVGTAQMRFQYVRADLKDPPAWSYTPGQRRVRKAPENSYDTVSTTSGVLLFDEINGFDGKMDKFDFKLLGKKEVIVPYNDYRRFLMPQPQALGKLHVLPEAVRWELHRVWVVEATLKDGQRHVEKRKKFYIDEDSWAFLVYVGFDQQDKPYHYMENHVYQEYNKPMLRSNSVYDLYDLSTAKRSSNGVPGTDGVGYTWVDKYPGNTFTPAGLTGAGVR